MAEDPDSIITPEMRACIGFASEVAILPEEIAGSDVRRYADATGDANPLWMNEEYARAAGYRGRVVPPLMVLQLYRRMGKLQDVWKQVPLPAGYTDVRNTGQEVEWLRPVYVGERLTLQHRIVDMAARQGRAGLGIYLTRESEFRNQAGEVAVVVRATSVRLPARQYAPEGGPSEA